MKVKTISSKGREFGVERSLVVGLLSILLTAPAWGLDYALSLPEAGKRLVTLNFESVLENQRCELKPVELMITLPKFHPQKSAKETLGRIGIKTVKSENCLPAKGSHTGRITLPLGSDLPAVDSGFYLLDIDGRTSNKVLEINGEDSGLIDSEDLAQ